MSFWKGIQYISMWPFKRQKKSQESPQPVVSCSHCGSTNTRLIVYHGTNQADYVRTWRGQRFLTYRCRDCGLDFYSEEPPAGIDADIESDDNIIDDEEALQAAEEEIERQVEEDDDRRCR